MRNDSRATLPSSSIAILMNTCDASVSEASWQEMLSQASARADGSLAPTAVVRSAKSQRLGNGPLALHTERPSGEGSSPYDGGFPAPMFSAASGNQCLKERHRSQYCAKPSKHVRSSMESTNHAVRQVQATAVDRAVSSRTSW